jgi:hypothetical protein
MVKGEYPLEFGTGHFHILRNFLCGTIANPTDDELIIALVFLVSNKKAAYDVL